MLHLLPNAQKKKIRNEYIFRVIIISLMAISSVLVVGIVFLMPSYVISYGKYAEVNNRKAYLVEKLNSQSVDKIAEQVNSMSADVSALQNLGSKSFPTDLINKLSTRKYPGASINHISYTLGADLSVTLDIIGVADNRDVLDSFTKELRKEPLFKSVNIPISSLAKDKDIGFSYKININ